MNIVFRVDSAYHIGSGHVIRCLALADALSEKGFKCSFICQNFDGNLFNLIESKGYHLYPLLCKKYDVKKKIGQRYVHEHWLGMPIENDAYQSVDIVEQINPQIDWLIIDHYAIDEKWEKIVRPYVKKIMVIDDLADRRHDCDLLLDQNYFFNFVERYEKLIPPVSKRLLGPKYAILRKEFNDQRINLKPYKERFKQGKILIFFGGMDASNETDKALKGLIGALKENDSIEVVLGKNNKNITYLYESYSKYEEVTLNIQVPDMAKRLAESYLFIGAVGTITWERCVMHLPGIVTSVAQNQIEVACTLNELNSHIYLGSVGNTLPADYRIAYQKICNDLNLLNVMADTSGELMDVNSVESIISMIIYYDK